MPHDPFAILGLPRRFELEASAVQSAYLRRSAGRHPDRAGQGGLGEDQDDGAAELNAARQVLADPEARANALLALLGGPAKEQDRSLPDGFLMEMMETRERIDEATTAGDTREIERWIAWADARRLAHIAAAASMFKGLADPPLPEALRAIRRELNAWRYVERLIQQVQQGDEEGAR